MNALAALLLLVPAQTLDLPATVSVPSPGLVVVRPNKVDADDVAWTSLDPGLQLIPADLLQKRDCAVGFASANGTYRLQAVCAKAVSGKAVQSPFYTVLVVVGQPPPPADPLVQAVKAAYAAETDAARATLMTALAASYRAAAAAAQDSSVTTFAALNARFRADASARGVSGKLPAVQKVITSSVLNVLPTTPTTPLDAASRKMAADAFTRAAAILEAAGSPSKANRRKSLPPRRTTRTRSKR